MRFLLAPPGAAGSGGPRRNNRCRELELFRNLCSGGLFQSCSGGHELAGMATDRDAGTLVPQQWMAVLNAVFDGCAAARSTSVETGVISLRAKGISRGTARTVLRVLRRRGYVCTTGESVNGAPLRWSLTPAGRALRKPMVRL